MKRDPCAEPPGFINEAGDEADNKWLKTICLIVIIPVAAFLFLTIFNFAIYPRISHNYSVRFITVRSIAFSSDTTHDGRFVIKLVTVEPVGNNDIQLQTAIIIDKEEFSKIKRGTVYLLTYKITTVKYWTDSISSRPARNNYELQSHAGPILK